MFKVTDEESNEIGKTAKKALSVYLRLDDQPEPRNQGRPLIWT